MLRTNVAISHWVVVIMHNGTKTIFDTYGSPTPWQELNLSTLI